MSTGTGPSLLPRMIRDNTLVAWTATSDRDDEMVDWVRSACVMSIVTSLVSELLTRWTVWRERGLTKSNLILVVDVVMVTPWDAV